MNAALKTLLPALALTLAAAGAHAEEKVLNLYSARHYQTDEALYAGFTKKTGIPSTASKARRKNSSSA